MSFSVIIPARYASQRLPGKPLLAIGAQPMIQRVYTAAQRSLAQQVVVATDDQRIFDAVQAFGGEVVMTSADHRSGTERLQEVTRQMKLSPDSVVVNVQGDEPLIPAAVINQVAQNILQNPSASAATLCEPISDIEELLCPDNVKVVSDNNKLALYFSRSALPWCRDSYSRAMYADADGSPAVAVPEAWRHIGIYAYRVDLLNQFVSWPMAQLEALEKLEQLRILANGHNIHVDVACADVPPGVDTEKDLARVIALLNDEA